MSGSGRPWGVGLLGLYLLSCTPDKSSSLEAKSDNLPCAPCGPGEWCGGGGEAGQCGIPTLSQTPQWLTTLPGRFGGVLVQQDRSLLAAVATSDGQRFAVLSSSGRLLATQPHPVHAPELFFPQVLQRAAGTDETVVFGSWVGVVGMPYLEALSPARDSSRSVTGCGTECGMGDFDVDAEGRVAVAMNHGGGSHVLVRPPTGDAWLIDQRDPVNTITASDPVAVGGVAWAADGDLIVLGTTTQEAFLNVGEVQVGSGGPGTFLLKLSNTGAVRWLQEYPRLYAPHIWGLERSSDGSLFLFGDFKAGGPWGEATLPVYTDLLFASAEGTPKHHASFGPASHPEAHVYLSAWAVSDAGEVVATIRHACGGFTARRLTATGALAWEKTYLPERCHGWIFSPRPAFLGEEVLISATLSQGSLDLGGLRITADDNTVGFLMNVGR